MRTLFFIDALDLVLYVPLKAAGADTEIGLVLTVRGADILSLFLGTLPIGFAFLDDTGMNLLLLLRKSLFLGSSSSVNLYC